MAIENVSDASSTPKRTNRTKILSCGIRARVAKPGETEEQKKQWTDKMLKRNGRASIVFPSQSSFDKFLANEREWKVAEKQREKYQLVVDEVMRKYWAGELVERPKASKPMPMARESAPAAQ